MKSSIHQICSSNPPSILDWIRHPISPLRVPSTLLSLLSNPPSKSSTKFSIEEIFNQRLREVRHLTFNQIFLDSCDNKFKTDWGRTDLNLSSGEPHICAGTYETGINTFCSTVLTKVLLYTMLKTAQLRWRCCNYHLMSVFRLTQRQWCLSLCYATHVCHHIRCY